MKKLSNFQGRKDITLQDLIPNLKDIWSQNNAFPYFKAKLYSTDKYLFNCDVCGKEFSSTPQALRDRKEAGKIGCKHCYGGYHPPEKGQSFAEVRPDLLKWFNYEKNFPFKPEFLSVGSNKKFHWKCNECGYEWVSTFNTMRNREPNCIKCGLYKNFSGTVAKTTGEWLIENNLSLVGNGAPLDRTVLRDSRVDLKCNKCNGVFNRNLLDVSRDKEEDFIVCPYCSDREVFTGLNDVLTYCKNNDISLEDYRGSLDLSKELPSSHKLTEWWCERHNGVYSQSIRGHILDKYSCNICSGAYFVKGVNDFKTKCIANNKLHLLEEWDDERNPEDFPSNTNIIVKWKCKQGHSFESQISARFTGNNCPICSGYKVVAGINDFETCNPDLMLDWDWEENSVKPSEIGKGASYRAKWKCHKCGFKWSSLVSDRNYFNRMSKTSSVSPNACPNCAIQEKKSFLEIRLYEILKKHIPDLQSGYIVKGPNFSWSVDMYSPSKKIAVEFNGIYWHSEQYVGRQRHLQKMKGLESIEVTLFQIWEDDFLKKEQIVVNALLSKFGVLKQEKINARECEISKIDFERAKVFLDNNHIQGSVSGDFYLGAFRKGILVGVMVLQDQEIKSGKFSLIKRFATSCNVRGLFSKMLNKIELKDGYKFLTFSDNCISDGSLYKQNGFVFVKELEPTYYINTGDGVRHHKFGYRKSFFKDNKDTLVYNENMTEFELQDANKFLRVWDAGKKVWVKG